MSIFNIKLNDNFQIKLARAAEQLTRSHADAAQQTMMDLAHETYAKAQEMASQRLNTTREKYQSHLTYLILAVL